jgi:hypothetical protein
MLDTAFTKLRCIVRTNLDLFQPKDEKYFRKFVSIMNTGMHINTKHHGKKPSVVAASFLFMFQTRTVTCFPLCAYPIVSYVF